MGTGSNDASLPTLTVLVDSTAVPYRSFVAHSVSRWGLVSRPSAEYVDRENVAAFSNGRPCRLSGATILGSSWLLRHPPAYVSRAT